MRSMWSKRAPNGDNDTVRSMWSKRAPNGHNDTVRTCVGCTARCAVDCTERLQRCACGRTLCAVCWNRWRHSSGYSGKTEVWFRCIGREACPWCKESPSTAPASLLDSRASDYCQCIACGACAKDGEMRVMHTRRDGTVVTLVDGLKVHAEAWETYDRHHMRLASCVWCSRSRTAWGMLHPSGQSDIHAVPSPATPTSLGNCSQK